MSQDVTPKNYVFLLLDGFSPLGFHCAVETLAHANRYHSDATCYSWKILHERETHAVGWNGFHVPCDAGLVPLRHDDVLVVVGGERIAEATTVPVINWLRREARRGVTIGAISSAVYTLGKAGLLSEKQVTTHWEYHASLSEMMAQVKLVDNIFTEDGTIFTCAGGVASMDLMLHRIFRDYGEDLAGWVADQMIYTMPRSTEHAQRISVLNKTGIRHLKLAQAVELMEANLEDPISPQEIAAYVELSTRQLERLFARYLSTSPRKYYFQLRLEKARQLLMQTNLPVIDVAIACGFQSPSHFSKSYRAAFGLTPRQESSGSKLPWSSA